MLLRRTKAKETPAALKDTSRKKGSMNKRQQTERERDRWVAVRHGPFKPLRGVYGSLSLCISSLLVLIGSQQHHFQPGSLLASVYIYLPLPSYTQ